MKRGFKIILVIACALGVSAAQAQPAGRGGGAARGARGDASGGALLHHMLEPSKQDEGPLKPGEEAQLMQFAQDHVPKIAKVLSELKTKKPETYTTKLDQIAPRLRHLKRLFATHPQIAAKIAKFADNRVENEKLRQQHKDAKPELKPALEQQIRKHLTENVDIEQDVLAFRLNELEKTPDQAAQNEMKGLLAPDTDLADESKEMRDLIGQARGHDPADAQFPVFARLLQRIRERQVGQADSIRERLKKLRESRSETVDEQFKGLMSGD